MERSGDEKVIKYIENMEVSTHRMAKLTRQVLAYSRSGMYHSETVIFREFLKSTLRLIRHSIPSTIHVEQDFPDSHLEINADLTQMQTVIAAVVENSTEAIESQGRIRITFDQEEIDETSARHHLVLKPGCYVCLTIEDDGRGMDEENASKIFEPFFTTKFQGRGLAMAAAFGIVKNHEGWISVSSELGKGTAVRIFLPAFETKP
jgi:signal transduction histidine kinase